MAALFLRESQGGILRIETHLLMDGRLFVSTKNLTRFVVRLLMMSAQVDGTVHVRLWIHHAFPNLLRINNKNKVI